MEPTDALYSYNIDASAYGMRVRPGYVEHANSIAGDAVKTLIPYLGTAEDGSKDKLFACTSVGIYDVTSSVTNPTAVHTWANSGSNAGWCSYVVFTNDAGARVLLVADLHNGLVAYTESAATWGVPTISGGPSAADLVHVMLYKHRVWYTEKDSNSAWYTATGTFSGALTEFNFGNKFISGGYLKGVWNWSLDSGDGPDDFLVAVSSSGDVLVYRGTDPASASEFSTLGTWFIGKVPNGRRCAISVGGDLYLLSSYGIISAKDLLSGKNPFTFEGSVSYKISPLLNNSIRSTINQHGWAIWVVPDLAKLVVTTPKIGNQPYIQFVYDVNTQAWSIWRGMPMISVGTFRNNVYTGAGPQVHWITGNLDNVTLAAPNPQPVFWSFLTGYGDMGSPQMSKLVAFIRPRFVAEGEPSYRVLAFYDYDLSELTQSSSFVESPNVWDIGLWDTAIWGGGQGQFQLLNGGAGIGRNVAIAMSGSSTLKTTLADIGVMWQPAVTAQGIL
jgi:hypothetical protein